MRVGQRAGVTDPGRKRRRNEDAFVLDPPLFAVADGMGGAQAGEVASRLAAAAFREFHDADAYEPEARIEAIVQEANRRIYERARDDAHASGMGTTITTALLAGERVAVGHVGDSRAYRLRGGRLEQLTQDHSLVADLVRSGRLTPEEAETHPQRSVITRALGTDPEVDVDSFAVEAEPGDAFLLCSDGLTTMLADDEILEIVRTSESLETAARRLVKAANRGGGEDNITVVLFEVLEGEDAAADGVATANGDPQATEADLEDTLTGLEAVRADTVVVRPPAAREVEAPRAPSTWTRRALLAALAVAFVTLLVALAFWGVSRAHFVGAEDDRRIAVYQGLPWDLGAGVKLYRPRYVSQLLAVQLSPAERAGLLDHELLSYGEARRRLRRYEEEGTP